MTRTRLLMTIQAQTYNLDHLVRYISHTGSREVGATEHVRTEAEPIFAAYRYLELFFSDGSRVTLDGIQSQALLRVLSRSAQLLDLDQIDEAVLGPVLVHDTEGGDVILPARETGGPSGTPMPDGAPPQGDDSAPTRPEVGDFPVRLRTDPADLLLTRRADGHPADSGSRPT